MDDEGTMRVQVCACMFQAMSRDEVQAEKIETQKELLAFEEKFGRPVS